MALRQMVLASAAAGAEHGLFDGDADDALAASGLSYNRSIHCVIAGTLSMVVVAGFTAMWLVANELEDPFGADANDIDVLGYHAQFCEALDYQLQRAWLPSDLSVGLAVVPQCTSRSMAEAAAAHGDTVRVAPTGGCFGTEACLRRVLEATQLAK